MNGTCRIKNCERRADGSLCEACLSQMRRQEPKDGNRGSAWRRGL